jgi:hypothetical protein
VKLKTEIKEKEERVAKIERVEVVMKKKSLKKRTFL